MNDSSGLLETLSIITRGSKGRAHYQAGYDALGHLEQSVDGAGNVTQFTYQHDLLRKIRDANGNETSYAYDAARELTTVTYPDGAAETYSTSGGVLFGHTDRLGKTLQYAYDGLGRVTSALYPGLQNHFGGSVGQFYHYDGQKLIEMDDQTAGVTIHNYTYDSSWRVVVDNIFAGEKKTYVYAGTGSLISSYTIEPPSGTTGSTQSVSYTYGPNGQMAGETWSWLPSGQFTFEYTPTGQYCRMTFPNGQQRRFTYDNQDRLTNLDNTSPGGDTIASFDYAYDYDWQANAYSMRGQRTSVTVTAPGAANIVTGLTKYSYDARYQLVRADYPNNTYDAWTYDAIGNRLSRRVPIPGYTLPYTYYTNASGGNTQRLRNDSSYEFTYDAAGNVTGASASGISNPYIWDYANRLTSYGGKTYTYDLLGRTSTSASGSTTKYVAMNSHTVSERNTTSGVATDYIFGPGIDEPLAKHTASGSISYFGVDGLGSLVVATDLTGAVLNSTGYSPWGETNTATELFGYAGRETGGPSWYYRARYYDAAHGRFLSEDPIQEYLPVVGGAVYNYVGNSPVAFVDPMGMQQCRLSMRYGPARREQGWAEEWQLSAVHEYPQLMRITPTNILGRLIGAGENAVGSLGITREECLWTKYFVSTTYLRQHWSLVETCQCPDSRRELDGTDETILDQTRIRTDSAITYGSLGLSGYRPCPRPKW